MNKADQSTYHSKYKEESMDCQMFKCIKKHFFARAIAFVWHMLATG